MAHNPSAAELGFVRAAVITPELRVADVAFNVDATLQALRRAAASRVALAAFPELGITGYSCGDLFYQTVLLEAALASLPLIAEECATLQICALVGLPLSVEGRLYNCAAFLSPLGVLGVVPKRFLPSTNEFYEERWFTGADVAPAALPREIELQSGHNVPFGIDLLFAASNLPHCVVGVEICEDLWSVEPPSGAMALAGATILINPSASTEVLGKAGYRRDLVSQQSGRCLAAYLYAASGPGESTTDVVYGGQSMIAENGSIVAECERFHFDSQMAVADLDVQRLHNERVRSHTYGVETTPAVFRRIPFELPHAESPWPDNDLIRPSLTQRPFVPADPSRRAARCQEIFAIQSTGLAKRLRHTGAQRVTVGLSGGLDSTLALLVIVRAFDAVGLPRDGIEAITMPGFGTTARTKSNAEALAAHLDVTLRTIPIADAVRLHFADIGHAEDDHNVVFENAQARERTQILMDVANQIGGFVVGTGDLSEAALGWMTFNGDHMSMYHVNAGVPKTLVRYLVEWAADAVFSGEASAVLHDIVATPITPELLPLGEGAQLEQKTEDTIGPYVLHDFFLFQTLRFQYPPRKVEFLARQAFADVYDSATIRKWLAVFYRRFFAQQFKRSSMPDGPKVGTVALSPRGDWRMPSDASSALWLSELEKND